jgi:hypothetical protein
MLRSLFCLASKPGVLNKDPTVWLDGARPPTKVLANTFKLKMNLSFVSIKEICKKRIWQSGCERK